MSTAYNYFESVLLGFTTLQDVVRGRGLCVGGENNVSLAITEKALSK